MASANVARDTVNFVNFPSGEILLAPPKHQRKARPNRSIRTGLSPTLNERLA